MGCGYAKSLTFVVYPAILPMMVFNSLPFLAFFALLVVIYYVLPHRFRWVLLVLASLYFYATFNLTYVFLLLASALVAYVIGLGIGRAEQAGRKKGLLVLGVIASLAPLFIFKYLDFFADSLDALLAGIAIPILPQQIGWRLGLLLPAGLSFFTFSCVSYLADVYWGKLPAEPHAGRFLLYVSFFPKLLAGPIERARTFLPQLLRPVQFNSENVALGLQLMLWGLFKKVVIADRLAVFVDAAYQVPATSSPADLLLATYFFAFQIYCDFSGYTDIAIGAARVLGIDLMENFRRPYLSTSVREFWAHRWHLSLTTWFRDYMYIPLGGSRVGRLRFYFNLMAVFLVSGLWHGANWTFVIWGGLNGLYQVVEAMFRGTGDKVAKVTRLPVALAAVLSALLTFHLILVTWVFFRAASLADAVLIISRVAANLSVLPSVLVSRVYSMEFYISLFLIALLIVVELFDEKRAFWQGLRDRPTYLRWAVYYALLIALIVLGNWQLRQFVYMQF